ncbi:sulfotransferase [Sphingosinicella sp. LHD-64]|uniref:sulfotransferase family protein n=1 Tax=Sphingosinicella sp. LHD-64 TaxID=3072139 RepID=UPI00280E8181|nr:sulfotransferase [Sphingosinicella sp. LHD-64]MDQ8755519.1 sulfotransferase [Sphingosinicella sp. LHD-64]
MTAAHAESMELEVDGPPSRAAALASRGLEAAWRAGLLPRPILDPLAFEAAALGKRARDSFGPVQEWRTPYRLLVQSLREEADLNPLGLAMAHGQVVGALKARIRAQELWQQHPEILTRPIPAPVVILGPMRSGTTRLQRLLACDDRFAHTRLFESLHPVPTRGRVLKTCASLAALRLFNPAIPAIHPMRARQPDEEFGLFSLSFGSAQFEAQWRVPSFAAWWEAADTGWLYREFRALLQTISWARGAPVDRPWLLKAPQFLQDLPAFLDAFPDARLICLDRDLERVVGSSASLVWHQMRIQSDTTDRAWVGREWLRKTRLRRERALAARRARPDVPQIEVQCEAMDADWESEVTRIYDFLGKPLDDRLRRRMAGYVAGARGHEGHRYRLEQFGLSREAVLSG